MQSYTCALSSRARALSEKKSMTKAHSETFDQIRKDMIKIVDEFNTFLIRGRYHEAKADKAHQ